MIWINNQDKTVSSVDALIKECRNANVDSKITGSDAVNFLGMTNHYVNVKFLIRLINGQIKKDEDLLEYKGFVLGAIEGREVTDKTYQMLEDMAVRGGFKEEFDDAHKKDKIYKNDICKSVIVRSVQKFKSNMKKGIPTIGDFREVSGDIILNGVDFTNCQGLKFDIYSTIEMCNIKGLKGDLFIPKGCVIELNNSDLSGVKKLYGLVNCKVDLSHTEQLPESIDVSDAARARFMNSDLNNVKELKAGKCIDIDFAHARGLPEVIDVSLCEETNFTMADASNVKRIVFKTKNEAEHFCCWSKNFNGTAVYLDGGNFEHEYSLSRGGSYGVEL